MTQEQYQPMIASAYLIGQWGKDKEDIARYSCEIADELLKVYKERWEERQDLNNLNMLTQLQAGVIKERFIIEFGKSGKPAQDFLQFIDANTDFSQL
jgi:hypothetical protein